MVAFGSAKGTPTVIGSKMLDVLIAGQIAKISKKPTPLERV